MNIKNMYIFVVSHAAAMPPSRSNHFVRSVATKVAVVVLSVFVGSATPEQCLAQPTTIDRVLEEGHASWGRFEAFLGSCSVRVTEDYLQEISGGKSRSGQNTLRFDLVNENMAIATLLPSGGERLLCTNHAYAFVASRDGADNGWMLNELNVDRRDARKLFVARTEPVFIPVRVFGKSLKDIIVRSSIKSADSFITGGTERLAISFVAPESTKSADGDYIESGIVELEPDHSWRLRAFDLIISATSDIASERRGTGKFEGTIEYEGELDGFPLVKSYHAYSRFDLAPSVTSHTKYQYTEWKKSSSNEEDFRLTRYGISEPSDSRANVISRRNLITLNVLAFILISIAVVIRRYFLPLKSGQP